MNIYRYNRIRILYLFMFITAFAVLAYVGNFYNVRQIEERPCKPIRNTHYVPQKAPTSPTGYDVMSDRLRMVYARCQDEDIIRKSKHFRFPVSSNSDKPFYRFKRSQTCMCKVPKVASTMLSKLLLAAEYPANMSYIQKMPGYYVHDVNLTSRFQHDRCGATDDLKFVVVRNPYSRMYSAYIDKIVLGKFQRFAAKIDYFVTRNKTTHNYFENGVDIPKRFMCKSHHVTFESFLRWILFHYKVDWHFAPITTFCNPCNTQFNVIIKQENAREEMKYVTEHLPVSMDTAAFTDSSNVDKIRDLIVILNDLYSYNGLSEDACRVGHTNFTFVNERFWEALKMQGYISRDERSNGVVFRPYSSVKEAFDRFKALKVPFLNSEQRSVQRQEYLVDAYKSLDENLLKHFRFRFYADFQLFGYSLDPPS